MALWEGSGNVIALDVLRALAREPESADAFEAEVSLAAGQHPLLDAHPEATRRLLREMAGADAASAAVNARRLVEHLALALQGWLLVRSAPPAVSDAFIASRLGSHAGTSIGCCRPAPTSRRFSRGTEERREELRPAAQPSQQVHPVAAGGRRHASNQWCRLG
jgi:putative acyl-CoA dehydrogenase